MHWLVQLLYDDAAVSKGGRKCSKAVFLCRILICLYKKYTSPTLCILLKVQFLYLTDFSYWRALSCTHLFLDILRSARHGILYDCLWSNLTLCIMKLCSSPPPYTHLILQPSMSHLPKLWPDPAGQPANTTGYLIQLAFFYTSLSVWISLSQFHCPCEIMSSWFCACLAFIPLWQRGRG